ncbi:MAG: hypothetical protein JST00_36945 [Deltaproteobacteria bacterium]|nr:hypothetical protein [Deltaproteobacteria bacterium]
MRPIALLVFLVSCSPRPDVDVFSMPTPPLATCNELCASKGRSCSDEAFEAPNGETGGQLVSYGCGTCYGGSE